MNGMIHPRVQEWESKLKQIFDRIDDCLEDKYGRDYPLHPARARRGSTSSKSQDGLFNIGAFFSTGIGSRFGPGYVVEVRLVTLYKVPEKIRNQIEKEVIDSLQSELNIEFPGRHLRIEKDGCVYRIFGDLSLS